MARILEDEIVGDPLGRGYSGMDDAALLVSLNTADRSRNNHSLRPSAVFNGIDTTEWDSKTDAERQRIWNVLHMVSENSDEGIDLFGKELQEFVVVFGGGSTTAATLSVLRVESISRGVEIGWGVVKEKDLRLHTLTRAQPNPNN